jgi:hypothetical protein
VSVVVFHAARGTSQTVSPPLPPAKESPPQQVQQRLQGAPLEAHASRAANNLDTPHLTAAAAATDAAATLAHGQTPDSTATCVRGMSWHHCRLGTQPTVACSARMLLLCHYHPKHATDQPANPSNHLVVMYKPACAGVGCPLDSFIDRKDKPQALPNHHPTNCRGR